jgi:RNA polymerase sigma factor (sigma-70 family)
MSEEASQPVRKDPNFRGTNNRKLATAILDCRPQVFRFLLVSTEDVSAASELTQKCLLRALDNVVDIPDRNVAVQVMRGAVLVLRNYWHLRRLQFWRRGQTGGPSPETQLAGRQQVVVVWQAVGKMTNDQRVAFLLRFVEELKPAEIAEVTGLREETINALLFRALGKVRANLAAI